MEPLSPTLHWVRFELLVKTCLPVSVSFSYPASIVINKQFVTLAFETVWTPSLPTAFHPVILAAVDDARLNQSLLQRL